MEKLNDKWLRIVGLPIGITISNLISWHLGRFEFEWVGYLLTTVLQLVWGLAYWEAQRWVIIFGRRRFPALAQTGKRILFTFVGFMVNLLVWIPVIFLFFDWLDYPTVFAFTLNDLLLQYLVGLIFILIIGGIYEASYFFRKYQKANEEAEALRRINYQIQMDSLKNQVNPHFLFNSLNSLLSLIAQDPRKAETFVEELSSVYRYLLQTNEKELTPLEAELDFTASYFHLLQTRHGSSIRLDINVPPECAQYQIPTLSLQLLLENAVKHNRFSTHQPLQISMSIDDDKRLVVRNNVQRKMAQVKSNRVGLSNITAKYDLLGLGTVEITDDGAHFTVALPLAAPTRS